MRHLILIYLALTLLNVNAQQLSDNNIKTFITDTTTLRDAERFISKRTLQFDIAEPIQFRLDFDEIFDSIYSSNINYTHITHMFYGEHIDPDRWAGTICKSRGGGDPYKFIFYSVYEYGNSLNIEVLFGNDNW
jgi:hypothetical protein